MKKVVQDLTSGGIDWQREKWQSGLGSKFIHQGEKNAAKYADEVIVLSKGVQDYFKETYIGKISHICLSNSEYGIGASGSRMNSGIDYITLTNSALPTIYKDFYRRLYGVDLLKLGPLYEKHSDYIRNILRAKQIYTEEYLDQLMKSFPGAFDDMDDLKNVVYFNYLDEEDWGKRILAKLTHDLEVENS